MHAGFGSALAASGVFNFIGLSVLIGALGSCLFFITIVMSKKHSIHGIRGIALFPLIGIIVVSLAIATIMFCENALHMNDVSTNVTIGSVICYLALLPFLRGMYVKEKEHLINKALKFCAILLPILVFALFIVGNLYY